jgi:hypothetical protein
VNIEHVVELADNPTKRIRCYPQPGRGIAAGRWAAMDGGSLPHWTTLIEARGALS